MIFLFVLSEYIEETRRVGERREKEKGGRCINSMEREREIVSSKVCMKKKPESYKEQEREGIKRVSKKHSYILFAHKVDTYTLTREKQRERERRRKREG